MQTTDVTADPAARFQALTHQYSRYSRSAGGLSAVAGGVACLASYFAGAVLASTAVLQTLLIVIPLLWLAGKQWLAHRYYQRLGRVEELTTLSARRYHLLFSGFTAAVSLLVVGRVAGRLVPLGDSPIDLRALGYCAVVVCLPIVVWRWLRTPLEFIVGVFLLCQAALAFVGRSYDFGLGTAAFPVASAALILTGLRDHRRFLQLRAEMRDILATRTTSE